MDIESLRSYCLSKPSATEDVKWGADLCFTIGGKMFCVTCLEPPFKVTLKVADDEFEELCAVDSIAPADYVGRYKWVTISDAARFSEAEWHARIDKSYDLIRGKLPKKIRESL